MNNQRPLSRRKQVQLLIALTILCWATQTLLSQWGLGQTVAGGGRVVLRERATVVGGEVRLRQVAQVVPGAGLPASLGDLGVARFSEGQAQVDVSLDALRPMLAAAGVNLARVEFSGSATCQVIRSDAGAPAEPATVRVVSQPTVPAELTSEPTPSVGLTLRQKLLADLSTRLGVAEKDLDLQFQPSDESLLRLSEPMVRFDVTPRRADGLGAVGWDVSIQTGGSVRRATVRAVARAWQDRQVVRKPVLSRQVIQPDDLETRRVLIEAGTVEAKGDPRAAVGQVASRDLRPGMVLSDTVIEPAPLVRSGQLVTLTAERGGIRVRTVARAMDTGTYGQPVKVRCEATREVYAAVVDGQQTVTLGVSGEPLAAAVANDGSHR